MDVTSLYTVIPNDDGLLAFEYFPDQRTVKEPSLNTTPSDRTSTYTQLLFIRWQLLQTNYWRNHGY